MQADSTHLSPAELGGERRHQRHHARRPGLACAAQQRKGRVAAFILVVPTIAADIATGEVAAGRAASARTFRWCPLAQPARLGRLIVGALAGPVAHARLLLGRPGWRAGGVGGQFVAAH
jgi:hypothetical protein